MHRIGQSLAWVVWFASGCADEPVEPPPAAASQPIEAAEAAPETNADTSRAAVAPPDELVGPVSIAVIEPGAEPRRPIRLAGTELPWTVSLVTAVAEPVDVQPRTVPLRLVLNVGPKEEDANEVSFRMETVELLGLTGERARLDRGLRDGLHKLASTSGVLSTSTGALRLDVPKVAAEDHWVVDGVLSILRRNLRWAVAPAIEEPMGTGGRWDATVGSVQEEASPLGGAHYTVVSQPEEESTSLRVVPWRAGDDGTTAMQLDEGAGASPSDRFQLRGIAIQGGIVAGTTVVGSEVYFRRRRLPVSEQGQFLVAFGRNARSPSHLVLRFPDGTRSEHVFFVEQRDYETEAIDGLPEEMVHPSREVLKELNRVNRRIERVRQTVSKKPVALDSFRWPTRGKVTSTYGRKRILNGVPKGFHWGVDIAAPIGRLVRAPAPGVVVFAEKDVPLSGNVVILDHGLGLTSSFLHLNRIRVKVGDEIDRGDVLGKVGATGRATGPHLDWRMNVLETRVDPGLLVEGEP